MTDTVAGMTLFLHPMTSVSPSEPALTTALQPSGLAYTALPLLTVIVSRLEHL